MAMSSLFTSIVDNLFWIACGGYCVYLSIAKKELSRNIVILIRIGGIIVIVGGLIDLVMSFFRQ